MYRLKHTDGNAMTIAKLYEEYNTLLYGYVLKRTECRQSTEDIVQQVFLTIMEKEIALEAIENHKAYLLTLVRNEWINYLRKEKLQRQLQSEAMWRNRHMTTHDPLLEKEYRKTLQAAIERLPVQRRKVYQLSFELGMKNDEIAEVMSISMYTVKCQLQQARKEVRGCMKLMRA